ncbi:hypothetical protein M2140_000039 [Clostridiales Family XIII bacterium PM5-7]
MLKQLLVISDPEQEVGFEVLTDYCRTIQQLLGLNVAVLPIWPHGKVELVGDKGEIEIKIKTLKEAIDELELELEKNKDK